METERYELTRRASLEVLRAEAQDERETMIYGRARRGEDPWRFMQELPSVDELVVLLMRAEALERGGDEAPESGARRAAHAPHRDGVPAAEPNGVDDAGGREPLRRPLERLTRCHIPGRGLAARRRAPCP